MAWVSTEQALEWLRKILEERFDKRRLELTNGPNRLAPLAKWVVGEWSFPKDSDRGDFPKGVIDVDERTSERREQDTGETATLEVLIRIYFRSEGLREPGRITAIRYGDALLYTLMKEARGKRPRDGTGLPGWFRVWPTRMYPGAVEEYGLEGVEVRATVTLDLNEAFAL